MKYVSLTSVLSLAGCGLSNQLSGSIESDYALDFSEVRVFVQAQTVRVEYQRKIGPVQDKICKVIIDGEGLSPPPDTLTDDLFLQRVQLQRITADRRNFPDLRSGRVTLDAWNLEPGRTLEGDLDVVFEDGRTLRGTFAAPIEIPR